jgi:hypothetical protein
VARDADTIQAEIERARDALAVTVDQLTTRADPRRIVEQAKETVLSRWADPRVKSAVIAAGALIGFIVIRRLFR